MVTGEQHSPGLQFCTSTSTHRVSVHPPLSKEHEYSQYGSPVSSHILHCDPGGHSCDKQPTANKHKIHS